ncbi:MAG: globin [Sphingobium sp.]
MHKESQPPMTVADTPFNRIGGEPVVAKIVASFYDLIEREPCYAPLRALHAADLAPVRHALTRFLCGWLGGPRDWFDRGTCIMSLHRNFPISPAVAEEWAHAMRHAIMGRAGLDRDLADKMAGALDHMARAMVNSAA